MKKWIALISALVFALILTACGDKPEGTSSDVISQPDSAAVEIAPSVFAENTEQVFEQGTKVTAVAVTSGAVYEQAKTSLADVTGKIVVYDLQAVKDNAQVQPSGKLKVTFPLPADFSTNVTVYYVSDAGEREKLDTTVDADSRTASAELAHFSTYVLADVGEKLTPESTTTTTTLPATKNITTTTTTKATTTTTTTAAPTTTTTTAAKFSAFSSHNWIFRKVVEEGDSKFCRSYHLVLAEADQRLGESSASPYEEMVPPEYRDQEKPSYEFNGIQWYEGAGGGGAIKSVKEEGNTISIIGEDDGVIVLTRTGENTAEVKSSGSEIISLSAGIVFTIEE